MKKPFCFIGTDLHRHIEVDAERIRYDVPIHIPIPWDPVKEGSFDPTKVCEVEVRSFRKIPVIFRKSSPPIDIFIEVGNSSLSQDLFYEVGGSED